LSRVESRLERRELKLKVTSDAKDWLAEVGFDPQYGARPLKRALQKYVEDELARRVISGELAPGDTAVIGMLEGHLTFQRVENGSNIEDTPKLISA
jgi:ATP-dependent Clp protease ATP-binding subunit ClpB